MRHAPQNQQTNVVMRLLTVLLMQVAGHLVPQNRRMHPANKTALLPTLYFLATMHFDEIHRSHRLDHLIIHMYTVFHIRMCTTFTTELT